MMRDFGFSGDYKKLVMVVDDESINRQMLGFIISGDYEVLYAENGLQALDLINANKDRLALILLDLKMPELDGFGVMRELKKDNVLSGIPVIVLTAEKEWEVEALNLGAADFIPKPYDQPEVILARIRRTIQLAEDSAIMRKVERDELTGLYTTKFFYEYVREWDLYYPYLEMDAMALRLTHLDFIRKVYGDASADSLLREAAEQISAYIAVNNGLASRGEDDIFLLYTPHIQDAQPAREHFLGSRPWESAYPNVYPRLGICPVIERNESAAASSAGLPGSKEERNAGAQLYFAAAKTACHMAGEESGEDGPALRVAKRFKPQ